MKPLNIRARGYRLEPFGPAQWAEARVILMRSYADTTAAWWDEGLRRLREVPPNDEQQPLGMLMHGPNGLAGAALLFTSAPRDGSGGAWHVNPSSWAIDPSARMQALWMIGEGLKDPDRIYTALTPNAQALRILQRVGFEPVSHQRVMVLTPRAAASKAPAMRILNQADTLAQMRELPQSRFLHDHTRLGCRVCAIETPDGLQPLVLRTRRRARWLPAAEVIYAPSVETLAAASGPLSRHLLAQGRLLLEFDASEEATFDIPCTRLFRRRFARGPYAREGIDHLYSELVYLGIG